MKEANQPAFPEVLSTDSGNIKTVGGLTKREYFAAMCMSSLCQSIGATTAAEYSVRYADALIAELSKPTT